MIEWFIVYYSTSLICHNQLLLYIYLYIYIIILSFYVISWLHKQHPRNAGSYPHFSICMLSSPQLLWRQLQPLPRFRAPRSQGEFFVEAAMAASRRVAANGRARKEGWGIEKCQRVNEYHHNVNNYVIFGDRPFWIIYILYIYIIN